jgi:hypothetical protein
LRRAYREGDLGRRGVKMTGGEAQHGRIG